jgi:hypothetical protein
MDDLMKEPDLFKPSEQTSLTFEKLKSFSIKSLPTEPTIEMLILLKIFFQMINFKLRSQSENELWNECLHFFESGVCMNFSLK